MLSLFALVGRNGDAVESVRELIAVPHSIGTALLLYAKRNPLDALGIERMLQFRRRVAAEFDCLVRADSSTAINPRGPRTLLARQGLVGHIPLWDGPHDEKESNTAFDAVNIESDASDMLESASDPEEAS